MNSELLAKTIRRLQRAEGYTELNLPQRALDELDAIGEAGPFQAAIALLRGEALKVQKRYGEAVSPLKEAVALIPAPMNKRAWSSLSQCYRESGQAELAEMADLVVGNEPSQVSVVVGVAVLPSSIDVEALKQVVEELLNTSPKPSDPN